MIPPKKKLALGFGNNIDYEIVWNGSVYEALIREYAIRAEELSIARPITDERDLAISILAFLRAGSGGERFVAASSIIERFAARFEKKITLGGTSPRAALAMAVLGRSAALHLVTQNDYVRRLLPPESVYVCSNEEDTLYPHLIVQFCKGMQIEAGDINIRAPRDNRIIYHNDADNIRMALNEDFANLITEAEVFLISGLNAMQSDAVAVRMLASLKRIMTALPPAAQVYMEDGGVFESYIGRLIYDALIDRIDVFSLNEDEMEEHLGRSVDMLDPHQVSDALADLYAQFPVPAIVLHGMYWALAYGPDAERLLPALHGGVTMATTRYYRGDELTLDDYRTIESTPANKAGSEFAAAIQARLGSRVACVPVVHVEQAGATTVGLGDAFVGGFLAALAPRDA